MKDPIAHDLNGGDGDSSNNGNGSGQQQGNNNGSSNKLRDTLRKEFVGRLLDRNQDLIERLTKKGEKSLKELCQQQLPANSQDVRTKLPFYNSIYEQIQYQRDAYLVSTEYANIRKIERKEEEEDRKVYEQYRLSRRRQRQQQFRRFQVEDDDDEEEEDFHSYQRRRRLQRQRKQRQQQQALSASLQDDNDDDDSPIVNIQSWNTILNTQNKMPFSSTALGHVQIVNIGQWFIPSTTVKDALLPIVVDLPLGGLYNVALTATVNSIPLGQPIVDKALKNTLINFMSNPYWRQIIKNQSTKGIMMSSKTNSTSNTNTNTSTSANTNTTI